MTAASSGARAEVRKKILIAVLIAVAVSSLILLDSMTLGVLTRAENMTYDTRTVWLADTTPYTPDIVIVDLNEASLRAYEPIFGRWPWPRWVHGDLVDYIAGGGAKVIAFDVIFAERTLRSEIDEGSVEDMLALAENLDEDPYARDELVAQLSNIRPGAADDYFTNMVDFSGVTFNAAIFLIDQETYDNAPELGAGPLEITAIEESIGRFGLPAGGLPSRRFYNVTPPLADLAEASSGIGHINFFPDPDGPCRRSIPFVEFNGKLYPSMALATAAYALDLPLNEIRREGDFLVLGDRRIPLTPEGEIVIRYQGHNMITDTEAVSGGGERTVTRDVPPYRYIPYGFLLDAMNMQSSGLGDSVPDVLRPEFFRDKIVLVGATAAGLMDLRATPFSAINPGVEIHANLIDNILANRFLRTTPLWYLPLAVLLLSLVTGITAMMTRPIAGAGVALLFSSAYLIIAFASFKAGWWVEMVQPAVGVGGTYLFILIYKYVVEEAEKRRVRGAFGRYLSSAVLEEVLANPEGLTLGGRRKEMSVLFSDVAGFTTISERNTPEEVSNILNEYLSKMVDCVMRTGGILDKFIGDAVVAEWNAPGDQPDHAARACDCALDMMEELARLQERWRSEGREILDIRIGANTGEMVVGNMGSEEIFDFTVIGNEVNTGARLEPLNKDFSTKILIAGSTWDQAEEHAPGRFVGREVARVQVKGRKTSLRVYELVGRTSTVGDEKKRVVELFSEGLSAYLERRFEEAGRFFEEALELDPDDGPSRVYLGLAKELAENPPPDDWDGTYEQKTK